MEVGNPKLSGKMDCEHAQVFARHPLRKAKDMRPDQRSRRERPKAAVVREELARNLEISVTEVRHYQIERGISDVALQMPRWRDQLYQYVIRCKRGIAEPQTPAGEFVWRYAKWSINSRGFATNANLRRAAERIALAAGAAVEIAATTSTAARQRSRWTDAQ